MGITLPNESPMSIERFPEPRHWETGFYSFLKNPEVAPVIAEKKVPYRVNYLFRIFCVSTVTLFISSLFISSLISAITLSNFSLLNPLHIVVLSLPIYCITSAMMIFFKIIRKKDIFTNTPINPFTNRQWIHIPHVRAYTRKNETRYLPIFSCYVDVSTLDKSGSGIASGYYFIKEGEMRLAHSILQMIAVPLEVIAKMVYHVFRFLIIPFYIIYKMVMQYLSIKKVDSPFSVIDIAKEQLRSVYYILRSPGYGTAHLLSLFYSFIDPLAGRLAISCVERDWNDDVIRSRGLWLIKPERNFLFEGGGEKGQLSRHSFYLMGCLQPTALFLFENGRIVSATVPSAQAFDKISIPVYPL